MTKLFAKNAMIAVSAALIAAAPACRAAESSENPLKIYISANADKFRIGEQFYLDVRVENVSGKTVKLPANFFAPGLAGKTGYTFKIIESASEFKTAECSPPSDESDSKAVIALAPGEYHGFGKLSLTECFKFSKHGDYSAKAIFVSEGKKDAWSGRAESGPVSFTVLESRALSNSSEAEKLIADWEEKYDVATAPYFKRRLLELGLPAAIPVSAAIDRSDNYSLVSDLLSILAKLPCKESGDELLKFIKNANARQFSSNMPDGFSAGRMLVGEAILSMEKMTRETLKLEKKIHKEMNSAELWEKWWKENRNSFPDAIPAED